MEELEQQSDSPSASIRLNNSRPKIEPERELDTALDNKKIPDTSQAFVPGWITCVPQSRCFILTQFQEEKRWRSRIGQVPSLYKD